MITTVIFKVRRCVWIMQETNTTLDDDNHQKQRKKRGQLNKCLQF